MAVGFKEASNAVIEGNEIIYCAIGIGSDLSPFQPDSTIEVRGNRFAYNGIAIMFTSETGGNNVVDNIFEGNLTQVGYGGHGDNNNNERISGRAITGMTTRASIAMATASATARTSSIPMRTRSGSRCPSPVSSGLRR